MSRTSFSGEPLVAIFKTEVLKKYKMKNVNLLILITILTCISTFTFGQLFSEGLNRITDSLKNNNIDSIIIYDNQSERLKFRFSNETSCIEKSNQFVFWKKNGLYYVVAYTQCYQSYSVELKNSKFFNYVLNNLARIRIEEIQPVIHYSQSGSFESESISGITDFLITLGKIQLIKNLDHYFLETESFEAADKTIKNNDNYIYNQESSINTMKVLAEKELEEIYTLDKFKKK